MPIGPVLRSLAVVFCLALSTAAQAEDWRIVRLTGLASVVAPNGTETRASVGMTVPDSATFSTGPKSRAQLSRGEETILVSPTTVISPRESWLGGTTTILQQTGRIELEVQKKDYKHFSVETPLLAAVVKGTHFTVAIARGSSGVNVARGLVEVTNLRSGETTNLAAGQKASVAAREPGFTVSGTGKLPDVKAGPPRESQVRDVEASRQANPSGAAADGRGVDSAAGGGFGGSMGGFGGSVGSVGGGSGSTGGSIGGGVSGSAGGTGTGGSIGGGLSGGVGGGSGGISGGVSGSVGGSLGGSGGSIGAEVGGSVGGGLGGSGGSLGGSVGGSVSGSGGGVNGSVSGGVGGGLSGSGDGLAGGLSGDLGGSLGGSGGDLSGSVGGLSGGISGGLGGSGDGFGGSVGGDIR